MYVPCLPNFQMCCLNQWRPAFPWWLHARGGNSEAVVNGVTGWLTPPHHPAKLAEKMIDLLNNGEKSEKWGERGRALVKRKFSVERMVSKHLELYNQ